MFLELCTIVDPSLFGADFGAPPTGRAVLLVATLAVAHSKEPI
ncbi:hypothetical protein [Parathermosynechococcus lividus]